VPQPLTHSDAAVAEVGGHDEVTPLVHAHALQPPVHAGDQPPDAHHAGHCGPSVVAGAKGQTRQRRGKGQSPQSCGCWGSSTPAPGAQGRSRAKPRTQHARRDGAGLPGACPPRGDRAAPSPGQSPQLTPTANRR